MVVQYINGADGTPAFVVLPLDEFSKCYARVEPEESPASLLSADGLFVRLPHGGPGARIDLRQLIEVWMRRGTISVLAVNKRAQAYEKFEGEALNSLDPILRRCFLAPGSPYVNTMQATTAVVDALVETGVFSLEIQSMPGFYRPVQCLRINPEAAEAFLSLHGKPNNPLDLHRFLLP